MIGLISDTHGLLRPEALAALRGVDQIIHAGDAGTLMVLAALSAIAPVSAVRGNVDVGSWSQGLPTTRVVEAEGLLIYVLHDLGRLELDPAAAGFAAVISGHTHQPLIEQRRGVLYINPGSAGPRRFSLPTTVALLRVHAGVAEAELVPLPL